MNAHSAWIAWRDKQPINDYGRPDINPEGTFKAGWNAAYNEVANQQSQHTTDMEECLAKVRVCIREVAKIIGYA